MINMTEKYDNYQYKKYGQKQIEEIEDCRIQKSMEKAIEFYLKNYRDKF